MAQVKWITSDCGTSGAFVVARAESGVWLAGRNDDDTILWIGHSIADALSVLDECITRDERAPAPGYRDIRLSFRLHNPKAPAPVECKW